MRRRGLLLCLVVPLVGLIPVTAGAADSVTRAEGGDRILTAIELSRRAFPGNGTAGAAVVARDRDFADALAAAPLAVASGGSVLLNPAEGLDADVQAEIERLGADTVYLMGGEAAQSSEVERALKEDTAGVSQVIRVEDPEHQDRFGTAGAAARRAAALWGGDAGTHVLVTLGAHPLEERAWPDALSAGQLAGHARRPILLVQPDGVPVATDEALADLGADIVTVIGGTTAVPPEVAEDLAVGTVQRIGGATRYDTARLVADATAGLGASLDTVLAATGADFADGLAAGPAAVHLGGVLTLVHPMHLADSPHAHDWFADHAAVIGDIVVAGGPAAVAPDVLDQLAAATSGLADLGLSWQPVVTGLDRPVAIESTPGDGRLFVVERCGMIWATYPDGGKVEFLDLTNRVNCSGNEQGLLGLAFHPDYPANGRFFVYYTKAGANDTRLAEYRAIDGQADTNEAFVDDFPQFATNHNGGGLEFGLDGMLYLGLGDGGGSGDPQENGQDPSTKLGSILRYQITGQAGSAAAPSDNPFVGRDGNDFVWHYGLRNPFRFSFDGIDERLFIGDVGQGTREEVNGVGAAQGGLNFGWDVWEGTFCHEGPCDEAGYTFPVHEYPTDSPSAVTGGVVYRGHDIPALAGTYLYADAYEGSLRTLRLTDDGVATEKRTWTGVDAGSPVGFGTDHRGEVYVTDLAGGRLLKLVAN
ncbi:MAG TPA: PQQ-dependent sugar dehydrogenase [Nitriliruptorales bacterium]